ncbi:MAG: sensor histidine kinase, partial [Actinomadura rubrobrunea]|nr:sensor histidine kinase [Actinomadura rubrobrunea]
MNAPDLSRRGAGRLLHALRPVLVPGTAEPPGLLLPARTWLRGALLVLLLAATVGFTGGAIAIPLNIFDPRPAPFVASALGLLQAAPLLFAARWPLRAWRVSAAGHLLGALLLQERYFWPWPVTSWLAFLVILFFTAVGHERRVTAGVGAATVGGLIAPAVLIGAMPDWYGLILAGLVGLALAFGDAVRGRYVAELSLRRQEELRRRDLARQAVLEERARSA